MCGESYQTARELAEQLLGLAQREQDPALLLVAHCGAGDAPCSIWVSWLQPAHTCEQSTDPLRPSAAPLPMFLYGVDPGCLASPIWLGSCGMLGYPDQALQKNRRSADPGPGAVSSLSAWLLLWVFAAMSHQFLRERR